MTASRIPSVEGGIQPTLLTAKGDLLTASATSTVTNLPVGADGQTLVANSASASGLQWQSVLSPYAAGKNAIINGGMDIWQRGTSFTYGGAAYCADRWGMVTNGPAFTFARDSTTVPTGFTYSLKATAPSSGIAAIQTAIETANAIQYAGQNVTVSMYLATSNSSVVNWELDYSTSTDNALNGTWTTISLQSPTTTTTMTRYSATFAVPSTAKSLRLYIGSTTLPTSGTINITGVQLELGSTATAFSRAGGTIQGELAACQRYYWRSSTAATYATYGLGTGFNTSLVSIGINLPVTMRTAPSVLDYANLQVTDSVNNITASSITFTSASVTSNGYISVDAAVSGSTQFRPYFLRNNNNTAGYIGFGAEL